MKRWPQAAIVPVFLLASVLNSGCTGGTESNAAEGEPAAPAASSAAQQPQPAVDPRTALGSISPAIPLYAGAEYRADLSRRDEVMVRNQYGNGAQVYTLATNDSFPQVYHYYLTYLAQFRAFPAQNPYPREGQDWRSLEVQLNQAMQQPFIPGETLRSDGKQVILQVAETEAEPPTVIRYIVTPGPVASPVVADQQGGQPAAAPAAQAPAVTR